MLLRRVALGDNRMAKRLVCAVLALGFGGTAAAAVAADQAPAPGSKNGAVSAAEDTIGNAVGLVSAEMTSTAKGFVTAAAMSDMYEVEAGKIAQKRAHNAAIKDFAKQMVDAHTQTTAELKSILASNNIAVTPPRRLDSRRQSMLDNLNGAKDENFDARYLDQQIGAHREALILMRGYAKDGDDVHLKAFADKTRAIVEKHLNMAKNLERSYEGQQGAQR